MSNLCSDYKFKGCPASYYMGCPAYAKGINCWEEAEALACCDRELPEECADCPVYQSAMKVSIRVSVIGGD